LVSFGQRISFFVSRHQFACKVHDLANFFAFSFRLWSSISFFFFLLDLSRWQFVTDSFRFRLPNLEPPSFLFIHKSLNYSRFLLSGFKRRRHGTHFNSWFRESGFLGLSLALLIETFFLIGRLNIPALSEIDWDCHIWSRRFIPIVSFFLYLSFYWPYVLPNWTQAFKLYLNHL